MQKNWPEWLVYTKFAVNSKAYLATKISLFMVNYERKSRMGADIRRKRKIEKATEFTERMKIVQKKVRIALK